jgi:hypothetical protein
LVTTGPLLLHHRAMNHYERFTIAKGKSNSITNDYRNGYRSHACYVVSQLARSNDSSSLFSLDLIPQHLYSLSGPLDPRRLI